MGQEGVGSGTEGVGSETKELISGIERWNLGFGGVFRDRMK
jgi:hypothetical protein